MHTSVRQPEENYEQAYQETATAGLTYKNSAHNECYLTTGHLCRFSLNPVSNGSCGNVKLNVFKIQKESEIMTGLGALAFRSV